MEMKEITTPSLMQALRVCTLANRPAFTWGSPGIGKSDTHRALAASLGGVELSDRQPHPHGEIYGSCLLLDLRASQLDPTDTKGVPYVQDGTTQWARPAFFPSHEECAKYDHVLLFLDELNSALQAIQAPLYQLFLDRRLGEYILPENFRVFAAGNLETDRAIANRMSSALADRVFHFKLIVDNSDWESWALSADIHIAIIAFLRFRPDLLHAFDPKSGDKAQPTPRGWEYVSDVLKVMEAEGVDFDVQQAMICGKIGEAAGAELIGYLSIFRDLPRIDEIIMDPQNAELSDKPDVNYALTAALGSRATEENIDRIIQYAKRMGDHVGQEFEVATVRTAIKRCPDVQETRAYIEWATTNKAMI